MGNDEFILFVRKNTKSVKTNDVLGREIWTFIMEEDPRAKEIQKNQPCRWGSVGIFINDTNLPKTSTQFEFDIRILPDLYSYLLSL